MMLPSQPQLINKYTPNAPRRAYACRPERPCYRYKKCRYCLAKKRAFIMMQGNAAYDAMKLIYFETLSFPKAELHPMKALEALKKLRRLAFRRLPKGVKYICFLSVKPSPNPEICNPHFHILSSVLIGKLIGRYFAQILGNLRKSYDHSTVEGLIGFMKVLSYCFDQNYVPSLKFMPYRCRLITCSRGLSVGRPKDLLKWSSGLALQGIC